MDQQRNSGQFLTYSDQETRGRCAGRSYQDSEIQKAKGHKSIFARNSGRLEGHKKRWNSQGDENEWESISRDNQESGAGIMGQKKPPVEEDRQQRLRKTAWTSRTTELIGLRPSVHFQVRQVGKLAKAAILVQVPRLVDYIDYSTRQLGNESSQELVGSHSPMVQPILAETCDVTFSGWCHQSAVTSHVHIHPSPGSNLHHHFDFSTHHFFKLTDYGYVTGIVDSTHYPCNVALSPVPVQCTR
ncbi:hypothetical protein BJX63DRAFT_101574 [Aspergillus granulosus]|uniref:Uncharacterized protein n=1 Tax=Aspergillus granulosus TaxID=176169 RepID=A0ABR4GUF7_9EURO